MSNTYRWTVLAVGILANLLSAPHDRGAAAATIPAAEYHSTLRIQKVVDGMLIDTNVESRKEGSISVDYAAASPAGDWSIQYVAHAQITGGNQLTVDISGDLQRSSGFIPEPKASAYAWMRYYFAVTKKDSRAPSDPVPFLISARVHGSVTPGSTGVPAGVRSYVSYKDPLAANYEALIFVLVGGSSPQSQELSFHGLRAQSPDGIGSIAIWVEGEARSGAPYGCQSALQTQPVIGASKPASGCCLDVGVVSFV